jgi:hypothetical protein
MICLYLRQRIVKFPKDHEGCALRVNFPKTGNPRSIDGVRINENEGNTYFTQFSFFDFTLITISLGVRQFLDNQDKITAWDLDQAERLKKAESNFRGTRRKCI